MMFSLSNHISLVVFSVVCFKELNVNLWKSNIMLAQLQACTDYICMKMRIVWIK